MEPWSNIDATDSGNQASFQPPLITPKDNPVGASYGKSDGELITKYIYAIRYQVVNAVLMEADALKSRG